MYQDMCVSVYSIFSVERTSLRRTPHYIGLRGYSTGGRYAAVFRIVQSVRPGPRTGLHKIQAVRPISGLDGTPSGVSKDGTDYSRQRSTAKAPPK